MSTDLQSKPNYLATMKDSKAPIETRVSSVRELMLANKDKIGRGLAGMLRPEMAINVACNSIRKNPQLLECTPASLFGAVAEAGAYGWTCDGVLGHASLVPFRNNKQNVMEVVLVPGYKGWRDLVRRSGECDLSLESVHDGDEYQFHGRFLEPTHKMSDHPQRRFQPVTHAYCIGRLASGTVVCFSWSVGECLAHRDRYSSGWKRNPRKDNPWHQENEAFRVMCMKTVFLDAVHRGEFPMSVEARSYVERSQMVDTEVSFAESILGGDVLDAQHSPAIEHATVDDVLDSDQPTTATSAKQPRPDAELLDELCTRLAAATSQIDCQNVRREYTFATEAMAVEADARVMERKVEIKGR